VKNLDNTFLLILLLSVVIYWDWLSIAEKESHHQRSTRH